MDYTPADIELITHNRVRSRTPQHPRPPVVRRRTRLAQQLRRFADRLDD